MINNDFASDKTINLSLNETLIVTNSDIGSITISIQKEYFSIQSNNTSIVIQEIRNGSVKQQVTDKDRLTNKTISQTALSNINCGGDIVFDNIQQSIN